MLVSAFLPGWNRICPGSNVGDRAELEDPLEGFPSRRSAQMLRNHIVGTLQGIAYHASPSFALVFLKYDVGWVQKPLHSTFYTCQSYPGGCFRRLKKRNQRSSTSAELRNRNDYQRNYRAHLQILVSFSNFFKCKTCQKCMMMVQSVDQPWYVFENEPVDISTSEMYSTHV